MFMFLEAFFTEYGYAAVFLVLVACGLGVPIPEDITLVAGGVIAGLGHANVHLMFAVGMAGVLAGDGLMFSAGRLFGDRILKFRLVRRMVTPERYHQVQEKFDHYGNRVLFFARFLPGLRAPIYISAGISRRISYWQFLLMDGLAALISVPVWIYLGSYGAENIDWLMSKVKQFQMVVFVVIGIGVALFLWWWWKRHRRRQFFKERIAAIRADRRVPMSEFLADDVSAGDVSLNEAAAEGDLVDGAVVDGDSLKGIAPREALAKDKGKVKG